jgi:hypothetical protein
VACDVAEKREQVASALAAGCTEIGEESHSGEIYYSRKEQHSLGSVCNLRS